MGYVTGLALKMLEQIGSGTSIPWQDTELAVHLVSILGEFQGANKGAHGELMLALVESKIFSYPHHLVVMEFFEAVGHYGQFF